MIPAWFNPAGGLRYHWRAYRHQGRLWRPFIQDLAPWIRRWSPPEKRLVLVGPSGGYCLPLDFLGRFDCITLVEPDPTAYLIFKRRLKILSHPPRELRWVSSHLFRDESSFNPEPFLRFLDSQDDTAVLFANVLGQMGVLFPSTDLTDGLKNLGRQLQRRSHRSLLSFHDRYSGLLRPEGVFPVEHRSPLSESEMITRFYPAPGIQQAELMDHETSGLFSAVPATYFRWQIVPGSFHLIEGTQWTASCATVQNLDK